MTNATHLGDPPDHEGSEPPRVSDVGDVGDVGDVEALPGDAASADEPRDQSMLELLRDTYLVFDRRALGFTRMLLGFFLLADLFHRTNAWMDMYSSEGVLPTPLNLFRPQAFGAFSIFNAFNTPGELVFLWILMFVTYSCLLIGWKTRVAQILSLLFVVSMNGRVLLIENGGYVVHNLLLLWTLFLPLGQRFSVDGLQKSMRRRRERTEDELNDRTDLLLPEDEAPHVTILGAVLMIQLGAIYFFNVIHKTGPAWKNGTAVHYVLYVDRMVTPVVALVRDHIPDWGILFLTKMTMAFEAGIPVALLSPLGRVWAKRLAMVMILMLHIGFGVAMVLGPFAWALCIFATLLISREDVELAYDAMRREHRARTVVYDRTSPGALLACRLLKRFDLFELLTFRAEDDVPLGLAITKNGARVGRSAGFGDILAALPLGPIVALPLRTPGLKGAYDALFASLERHDLSRFFGLRFAPSTTADGPSPLRRAGRFGLGTVREVLVLVMFAGAVNQALVELWVFNRRFKIDQPEPLRLLAHKFRFLQGWFMFSPNPVMDDGTIVVDALTPDGRHIDPFTGKEPNFDLLHAKSLRLTQIWCDYFNRMHLPGNSGYREAMKEYMYRLPKRTGHPDDAIVMGEVFWIQDMNPLWSQTESYKFERQSLFTFENANLRADVARLKEAMPPPAPVPVVPPPVLPVALPEPVVPPLASASASASASAAPAAPSASASAPAARAAPSASASPAPVAP